MQTSICFLISSIPPFIDTDREDNSMCNPTGAPLPTDFQDVELGETSSVVSGAEESTQPLMKPRSSSASVASVTSTQSTPFEAKHHDKHDAGLGSAILDKLHPTHQMVILTFLMFLFFGMHNILQEAIVNLLSDSSTLKSNSTLMLGYAEVVGVLTFSFLERMHCTKEGGWTRVAPLSAYPLLTACLFASSSLSNLSLGFINFPTKVGK